jgi:hypothetical protein
MKMNNIKIKIADNAYLSFAQHYDETDQMVCCEVALIDHRGVNDPLPFSPDIESFRNVIATALRFQPDSLEDISRYICSECGGDHIGWDAWADENGDVISAMDHHECLECESENCAILVSDLQKHADSIVAQIAEGAA